MKNKVRRDIFEFKIVALFCRDFNRGKKMGREENEIRFRTLE